MSHDEFETEHDHRNKYYKSTDDHCDRRIGRGQLREVAPQTQQESHWADLARANDSAYEQEHDDAESDDNQAQEDHDSTIKDIHDWMVFP